MRNFMLDHARLLLWRAVKCMDNHCGPEPLLQQDLERAEPLREKVGAHMALGVYCHQREDLDEAEMHLEFVVDNANKPRILPAAVRPGGVPPSPHLRERAALAFWVSSAGKIKFCSRSTLGP